jgi:hypothetical protein
LAQKRFYVQQAQKRAQGDGGQIAADDQRLWGRGRVQ